MKKNNAGGLSAVLSLALMPLAIAAGPGNDQFAVADTAAREGRIADMEAAYSQILERAPRDVRALNGQATAQAWQGRYDDASATYERALAVDNDNLESLVGLGYTQAWAGRYTQAHTQFRNALRVDPKNIAARKGIAYAYFWQGENELALDSFELAQTFSPDDAEIEEASGRVNLLLGRTQEAVAHLDRALVLDPSRKSAKEARRSAFTSNPALELTARMGSTSDAGSGLRAVEVSRWAGSSTRLAVRYDNSLGLDNPSISDRGDDAPGYFAAVQQKLGERWLLGMEVGRRDFTNGNQSIVQFEGTYLTSFGATKLGAQSGRHDAGYTDMLVFGGINFRLGDHWQLEPMLYHATTGTADDVEWRAVANIEYQSGDVWNVGGFLGAGDIDAANPSFSGTTKVAGVWGSYLFADRYSLRLSLREEDSPAASFSVAELGLTYRWLGN